MKFQLSNERRWFSKFCVAGRSRDKHRVAAAWRACAVVVGTGSLCAHAADRTWIGGDGLWTQASNWSQGAVPGPGDHARFNVFDDFARVVTNVGVPLRITIGGSDNAISVESRGVLGCAEDMIVGNSSSAANFFVSETTPATIFNPAGQATVGGNLFAGAQSGTLGGRGAVTLSGGFLTVNGKFSVGHGRGSPGPSGNGFSVGTCNVFSSALTVDQGLNIGDGIGTGTMIVNGFANVNAGSLNIAMNKGGGTLIQSGGRVNVADTMTINLIDNQSTTNPFIFAGTYDMSGGTLTVGGATILGGGPRNAFFNVRGSAVANLEGLTTGMSTSTTSIGGARINQSGGRMNIGVSGLVFPAANLPNRTAMVYNLSGGSLNVAGPTNVGRSGTINFSGGAMSLGELNVNGGSVLFTAGGDKVLRCTDLVMPDGAGGTIDVNDNAIIVDFPGQSPLEIVGQYIAQGYNLGIPGAPGAWPNNITGIPRLTSTAARLAVQSATLVDTGLGYARSSELGLSQFMGQEVDGTSVLVRYTLYGDANLDQVVNINDFSRLAASFNLPSTWSRGDFNYDGITGIGDFSLVAANFNQSLATEPARSGPVPEPHSLVTFGFLAAALNGRRNRGRRRTDFAR